MHITIDQAQAFEAVARLGTVQKAAQNLHKGHSAIVYLLRTLEEQIGIALFDRSGYRNRVSEQGEVVLRYCQQLLHSRGELIRACENLKGGWEPIIKVIYDGVVDFNLMADALLHLRWAELPTEIKITAAYLKEVESKFIEEKADLMFTILPIHMRGLYHVSLRPIEMLLVCHKDHALADFKSRNKAQWEDLSRFAYVKVRETSGQIGLSTEKGIFKSSLLVNDFPTKREAILRGLGFGWLPEYLVQKELKSGRLQLVQTDLENRMLLHPRLYHRNTSQLGKAANNMVKFFRDNS